jgi:branched-chain amino acid transport system ATP-binding protein
MTILELNDVYKSFKGLSILNSVNLGVEEGECHAIIGPNGAGKSTLFNVISGRYQPTKGRIVFNGEDITGLRPYRISRKGLARSFQITNLFPRMTVYENIRNAVLSRKGMCFKSTKRLEAMAAVASETGELMEKIGLETIGNMPASELSYGEQRALEIGVTLATDPKLILLDEPTAGMAREQTRDAVKLIKSVTKGRTVMIVEHDMDVVFSMADRITVLSYGEVLASGRPEEIRGNDRVRSAYLGKRKDA